MTAPLLTIFTTCKPLRGKFETLQTNALRSWARLRPECDVVVIGDEPGVKECCEELGLQQVAEVPRSESGLCVDARKENIERLGELYPGLKGKVFDLEKDSFEDLGRFDIVFAYGVIYHLEDPFRALRSLASICDDLLLLETMVADHPLPLVRMTEETSTSNQALRNIGSRPTPSFVVLALRAAGFRHIYGPRTPPAHRDFDFIWTGDLSDSRDGHLLRSTFVASRAPLASASLVDLLS